MNIRNIQPTDCPDDRRGDLFTEIHVTQFIHSLTPAQTELLKQILADIDEMLAEGCESPDIEQYLRRTYGQG